MISILVPVGVIIGILSFSASSAIAFDGTEVTAPIIISTLSLETNFLYALTASLASPLSSTVISSSFLPFIPPCALISSIFSSTPSLVAIPYWATPPVSGPMNPILTTVLSSVFVSVPAAAVSAFFPQLTKVNVAIASNENSFFI